MGNEDRIRIVNAELMGGPMCSPEMRPYDIVFVGHMAAGHIKAFEREPSFGQGGASFFGAIAASCLTKRLAVVTRMAAANRDWLEPLSAAGIDVYLQPSAETTQMSIVYPSADVDNRQLIQYKSAGLYRIEEMPPLKPCLIHLGGLSDQEFTLEFMQALKDRGFRLSVDMQAFVFQVDKETGVIRFQDVAEKQQILTMVHFVKMDATEARILTGTDDPGVAAVMLEGWGCRETVITRADGVLARSNGKTYFQKFSNKGIEGRTGRGDTLMGAYLARRVEYPVEESLRFAASLTSIKVETEGPFRGTVEDVLEREKLGGP